ncbi:MAG UNVERIFIED_CONTAM: hypothetical protein LVR18_51655 [Planctomycetaceae bacterium]|jgi:hypothetical protein
MYFGTVGAVSGRFIFELDLDVPDNSGFWGVMKLDTNFEKLRPAGIDIDVFALLQFNFSNVDSHRNADAAWPGRRRR